MTPRGAFLFVMAASIFLAILTFSQKASVARPPTKDSVAEENVKQLLLLMDTDKNGKISKQEWMKFMEAQFDTLDKDKKGQLDRAELLESMVSLKRIRPAVGK